jgi:hypothetical protein
VWGLTAQIRRGTMLAPCSIAARQIACIIPTEGRLVPRKPNYGFEKRKKELDRQAKQEAKRQRKLAEAERRANELRRDVPAAGGGPAE